MVSKKNLNLNISLQMPVISIFWSVAHPLTPRSGSRAPAAEGASAAGGGLACCEGGLPEQ